MKTEYIKIDANRPDPELIYKASQCILEGGIVGIPTETVYGLVADYTSRKAMNKLKRLKKRPKGKPFSVHIPSVLSVDTYAKDISPAGYRVMETFWPGPLTAVVKSRKRGNIGLRVPSHPVARSILSMVDRPVVIPSANLSGKKPALRGKELKEAFEGKIEIILDAGSSSLGKPSTVVDLTGKRLKLLRKGPVKKKEIEKVAGRKVLLFVCTGNSCRSVMASFYLTEFLKKNYSKKSREWDIISAGTAVGGSFPPTQNTKRVLAKENIDASSFLSQRVTRQLINKSDLVLTMQPVHKRTLLELYPYAKKKIYTVGEFINNSNYSSIPDPIGSPLSGYEECFIFIKKASEEISKKL